MAQKLFDDQRFEDWVAGEHRLHLYLDSLDECLLRVDNVAAVLVDELEGCPVERLSLRIACRTAEWPELLERGLERMWGEEEAVGVYELTQLRRADAAAAARAKGLDADAFLTKVRDMDLGPLASKPVTLEFLADAYSRTGDLPANKTDLYLEGCRLLCEEINPGRRASGRTGDMNALQRLAVAARVAAVTVFANRYAVWTTVDRGDVPEEDALIEDICGGVEGTGASAVEVTESAVREVLDTELFSARGANRMGWAHQTYAEFLAARYLVERDVGTEQMMSLVAHPDDEEGSLVPQLHETAAWLASMSPDIFRRVTVVDPEVLLRSDVASAGMEDKVALSGTLLRLYDEGKLLDVELVSPRRYRGLEHPRLAEQLRPYIIDPDKDFVVRRVALDIAEVCGLQSLQAEAAEVALDPTQSLFVRKEAASFVARVGDGPTRAILKPLATGAAGDDPDDDLRGHGLRAVWPDHIGSQELFGSLTPPNESYIGSYAGYLNHELPESLRLADLPAALAWVERQPSRHGSPLRFEGLMDRIMVRAWDHLSDPNVRTAFARAALARVRHHDEIVEQRSTFAVVDEGPSFRELVAADAEKRRNLVEEMLDMLTEDDVSLLVYSRVPLVTSEDVPWLIERLETTPSDGVERVLATLIMRAFDQRDNDQYELVYKAQSRNLVLAGAVGGVFGAVELASEEAQRLREYHEQAERLRAQREIDPSPEPPNPPLVERVVRSLDDFEAGNTEAFWQNVDYYLRFEPGGVSWTTGYEEDLAAFPGWEAADDATKGRIIEAAKVFAIEGDPSTEEWLGTNQWYNSALAGYRAFRLLLDRAPHLLLEVSDDAWARWTPTILHFPVGTGTGEERPHLELVGMAYRRVPDAVIDTVLPIIDKENENNGAVFVTRKLERCWDGRLAAALLEKAKETGLKPQSTGSLLNDLLDHDSSAARELAEALVSAVPSDEESRARAVAAAQALIFHTDDAAWSVVWPSVQADPQFGGALVDAIASDAHHTGHPQRLLSEQQVADLYVWLVRRYPHSEYNLRRLQGRMGAVGRVDSIAWWRDDVLSELTGRGTRSALEQAERMAAELPDLDMRWTLQRARVETRRQTWTPPAPRAVLDLAARRAAVYAAGRSQRTSQGSARKRRSTTRATSSMSLTSYSTANSTMAFSRPLRLTMASSS